MIKKKICLVEDEDSIREIYKTALEKRGYQVSTASDGEEGLKSLQFEKPDLLILDIIMPKMNGVELLEKIRNNSNLSGLPVIVMSNVDDRETLKKVGKYNTSFYLIKSHFEPSKMVHIVDEVLQNY